MRKRARADWTDARLLLDARHDPDAFHLFYERYATRVCGYFGRRTRDREASLDLTAETFARAWLGRAAFRDLAGGSAGPWLFAIARRVLAASVEKRQLESEARRRLGFLRVTEATPADPAPGWLTPVGDAFDELPETQRRAVTLRVVDECSYDAVAAELGCSATAARIRVSRGLAALRHAMEGETP
jgi:RNA polymerase sigma-70 factor, ECF subfamily